MLPGWSKSFPGKGVLKQEALVPSHAYFQCAFSHDKAETVNQVERDPTVLSICIRVCDWVAIEYFHQIDYCHHNWSMMLSAFPSADPKIRLVKTLNRMVLRSIAALSLQTQEEARTYDRSRDSGLTSRNRLLREWFRAKCIEDAYWCTWWQRHGEHELLLTGSLRQGDSLSWWGSQHILAHKESWNRDSISHFLKSVLNSDQNQVILKAVHGGITMWRNSLFCVWFWEEPEGSARLF